MTSSHDLCALLAQHHYTDYTGVPCSFLTGLINNAMQDYHYINATNEGDAVAIAAGLVLAGKQPIVLMQNSGLGNAVSPITSLLNTFKLPVLLIIGWRGQPGISDEPQHTQMGTITLALLRLMAVTPFVLGEANLTTQLDQINLNRQAGKSSALLIPKNSLRNSLTDKPINKPVIDTHTATKLGRTDALRCIIAHTPQHAVIMATTGKTGRELATLGDSDRYFYQVGSMGCVSAIALGISQANPNQPLIIIDGDGAALMRLGAWASIGERQPTHYLHIILNNGVHDSTGGQATVTSHTAFTGVARAMNYSVAKTAHTDDDITRSITDWIASPQLTLLEIIIKPGSPQSLGRPTCSPESVATRLNHYLRR